MDWARVRIGMGQGGCKKEKDRMDSSKYIKNGVGVGVHA